MSHILLVHILICFSHIFQLISTVFSLLIFSLMFIKGYSLVTENSSSFNILPESFLKVVYNTCNPATRPFLPVELLITLTIYLGPIQFLNTSFLILTTLLPSPFSSNDSICKAIEVTLIIRAKTIEHNGLNARDERHSPDIYRPVNFLRKPLF